ncbi:MAG TPA: hypothetical protein VGL22_11915 [Terracidiphilus sp.]
MDDMVWMQPAAVGSITATPHPPLRMEAAKPQLAPPQVAQVAQVVAAPRKPSTTPPLINRKEIDRILEQLYSGILPGESRNQHPHPLPPLRMEAAKPQLAPPQVVPARNA